MKSKPVEAASPPAGSSIGRMLAPSIVLLGVLVAVTAFLMVAPWALLRQSRDWVSHTHEVIETSRQLFTDAQDVESSTRGYLLSNDASFLDPVTSGQSAFPAAAARLRRLVADNPAELARVDRLIRLLKYRMDVSAYRIGLARQGRLQEARSMRFPEGNQAAEGKQAMEEARRLMAEILRTENALLARRNVDADRAEIVTFAIAVAISLLSFAGLVSLMVSMAAANRGMAHQISEREAAEAAQRESEALYRAIFANAMDYMYVIDVSPEGRFTVAEFNPAFEQATGLKTAALRGVDLRAFDTPMASSLIARLGRLIATGAPVFTREFVQVAGRPRTWEVSLNAVRDGRGRVERVVATARDVTERDQAEEQLRRAHRMEAVGHLTGGVAHDFNNLLQVIRGNLELLTPLVHDHANALAKVKNALRGADRAAQLTRQLLAFARRQPLEPKVVNLGRLVNDMADMLRRTLGEAIEVETVQAGGLWNTLVDPAQVESAILNLAINARDAMPGGGHLTIEITNAVLDHGYASRDAEIEPGQYVMLAVTDTGHGMNKETLARVFEPFFTTKSEEKGTGLGLSMVYGFVKQSRGHIQIYSEVDQGTTVKIYLPRVLQDETQIRPSEGGSAVGASEVVLVVEDNELVRNSVVSLLRDLGYACLHAHDGAAALKILQTGARIDLLFTDVVMPGPVKSRDLATQAQTMRPRLPVLFTSGYTENAIVHQGRLDEGVQLLSKPYTRDDLARRVGGLLRAARPVVLVVEDDTLVRMSAVDMIESLGFTPIEAVDAEAALRILNSPTRIDVLFTDVGLPGMRGPQLAEQAAVLRPGLKVVFATGYGETTETSRMAGAAYLDKPYERDRLSAVLAAAVG